MVKNSDHCQQQRYTNESSRITPGLLVANAPPLLWRGWRRFTDDWLRHSDSGSGQGRSGVSCRSHRHGHCVKDGHDGAGRDVSVYNGQRPDERAGWWRHHDGDGSLARRLPTRAQIAASRFRRVCCRSLQAHIQASGPTVRAGTEHRRPLDNGKQQDDQESARRLLVRQLERPQHIDVHRNAAVIISAPSDAPGLHTHHPPRVHATVHLITPVRLLLQSSLQTTLCTILALSLTKNQLPD